MSDSGRQIGDCKHARRREICPECTCDERIRAALTFVSVPSTEYIAGAPSLGHCILQRAELIAAAKTVLAGIEAIILRNYFAGESISPYPGLQALKNAIAKAEEKP